MKYFHLVFSLCLFASAGLAQDVPHPKVMDPRLEVSLVAHEPELVTPVALAADHRGNLYVLETNTHARKPEYRGAASDRIFAFTDNGDDAFDRKRIVADGLRNALSMCFLSDGRLLVLQMKSLLVLSDADGDGLFETRHTLLTVETDNNNHHGVFLAVVVDDRDRIYLSLGNIGGQAYTIRGSDSTALSGQGDTGLIVRCEKDGAQVERFASGFWNPCGLIFDAAGRLIATDNDPDARGPNRILHVIPGGRYGYQSRFGASGLHPFDAWNGELPGTLPMLAGVGEAPVGVLDCASSSLPADYATDLLVAVWGTNRVDRVRTRPRGSSLLGQIEPLLVGETTFRPTAIVATTDGNVYIADWADRRYPVHGKGRLWRLSVKADEPRLVPAPPFTKPNRDPRAGQLEQVMAGDVDSVETLLGLATGNDPFLSSAALSALSSSSHQARMKSLLQHSEDRSVRLAALLALRESVGKLDAEFLESVLNDGDPVVRKMAMICIGEAGRFDLADALLESMPLQTVSADLFETFLAASQTLTEAEAERVRQQIPGTKIDRSVDQALIRRVLQDSEQPNDVRAMAVRYLDVTNELDDESIGLLVELAASSDKQLARESIRSLGISSSVRSRDALLAIANDRSLDASLRADAIASMTASPPSSILPLLALVRDSSPRVALAAARAIGQPDEHDTVASELRSMLSKVEDRPDARRLAHQLQFALGLSSAAERPQSDLQWMEVVEGGDSEAGSRVFFDARVTCAKCHRIDGRGGEIGPDLSNLARAKTPKQILQSILHPSSERSPDYQGYAVVMLDGRTYLGTQFHYRGESADLLTVDGTWIRFALEEAEDYRPLDRSLMPEGLVELMSLEELKDLMAYLTQSR